MKLISYLWLRPIINQRSYSSSSSVTLRKPAYYHKLGKEPLVYRTLGQQFDSAAERFPTTEAVVSCHEGKRYTFTALKDKVERLAAGFIRLGLKIGDPIGIWAPNNTHWYLSMVAAAKAGLWSVVINPAFQGPEIEYCLQSVGIKAIIAAESFKTQQYYKILASICPELEGSQPGDIKSSNFPHLKSVIIDSDGKLPGAFRFEEILSLGDTSDAVAKVHALERFISADSPCNVQFSSGSTGRPKPILLSHLSIVNNGIQIATRNELDGGRICVQVPLFHSFGVVATISAGISHGATLVLPDAGFNPAASLHAIVNEKCSVIHGTPTMFVDIVRKQKELAAPIKTAKYAVIGGSPCSPQLVKDVKEVLGIKTVKAVFGMTECTSVSFQSLPGEDEDRQMYTVGHVSDHVEAKVIDFAGNTVPFGEPGELCVRGYFLMLGYFGDEEKTKQTLGSDRWLKTGDQFVLYEDGYGQIVGRLKEMIIRGGENIFPKEIEDALNAHPDILESYVIGVEDDRMGEEICAFVRLQRGKQLTQQDVMEFCKGKVAHFKVPRYLQVVAELPKTTSGKIRKLKLKELYTKTQKDGK